MGGRLVIAAFLAIGAGVLGASASCAKPAPTDRCPEAPADAQFNPADLESMKRQLVGAPRIVLALGADRHDQLRDALARGENPNVCVMGGSVLALSAVAGDVEEVRILIDGGADLERPRDSNGGTPLLTALGLGKFEVARLLIERGADVRAAADGNMTALIELASVYPTPAAPAQQVALAETLVSGGVPVDGRVTVPGTTALMMAAIRGNLPLAQMLLRRGADPRLENRKGQTASAFALKKGYKDLADVLARADRPGTPAPSANPSAQSASAREQGN